MTVSNIAVKAGLEGGERYIDANTLPEDFEELREVVPNYTVYGRVRPEQKQRIVKAYQANGSVVGMVGDGVNDVLALKDADCSVAMASGSDAAAQASQLALKDANCGIAMAAGSDAAKQVAHIVLMDSNFASMKSIVREGRMIISNIERVSALYLTKTIYSVLLSIIFIILGRTYPFVPIHLSIISTTAIGIPSFILTLEQTETVTSNGFMRNVLRISLPSALTMVIMMLINQVVAGFFGFDSLMLSTYNLILAGCISQMVVWEVCRPMNTRRRVLCIAVGVIFVAAIFFLPGFFNITHILNWRLIFIIPLMILTGCLMQWLTKAVRILTKQR